MIATITVLAVALIVTFAALVFLLCEHGKLSLAYKSYQRAHSTDDRAYYRERNDARDTIEKQDRKWAQVPEDIRAKLDQNESLREVFHA